METCVLTEYGWLQNRGGGLLATLSLIFRDQLVSDVLGPADFEFDLEILNFEFSLPAPAP